MDGNGGSLRAHGSGGAFDEEEFRIALVREREGLFRFLLKLSGDEEEALDIAQEAMARAIMKRASFRGESSFRTWLLAIAANLYRDELRRKRPRRFGEAEDPDDGGSDAAAAERRAEDSRARRALAALPAKKRAAVLLRFDSGLAFEEIGRILRCPVGTARRRVHEALKDLREAMGVEYEG